MLVAGPFAGVLVRRYSGRLPLALGALISSSSLLAMALDHSTEAAMVAWNLTNSIGIGLAFAAMPNLIFAAVPQSETGEATGFNTLVRSVGASLGSQITAAILTGSVVAGSVFPTDDGYTAAFLVSAGIAIVAAIFAIMIPPASQPAPVTAHATPAQPAYAER
jgi:MFS family permease